MSEHVLYRKYRPKTLDRIIGHTNTVTQLQGIIKSGKFPGAMLFTGPTSAGKTTLGRAFAATVLGVKNPLGHHDFKELNAADSRGIDEVRELVAFARYKPRGNKRFILLDEAQQFTGPAAQLLLKPFEDPPPDTIWIICSMEPEKLLPAIRNRPSANFRLKTPGAEDIDKFVKRILKGEEMTYVTDPIREKIVQFSDGQYRNAANMVEGIQRWMAGLAEPPKKIDEADLEEALSSSEDNDALLAVQVVAAIYARNFKVVHKALLDVQQHFTFMNKLMNLNGYMLNKLVMDGEKHPSYWFSRDNLALEEKFPSLIKGVELDEKFKLQLFGTVQSSLVRLKQQAFNFSIQESFLISSYLFELINEVKVLVQKNKKKE